MGENRVDHGDQHDELERLLREAEALRTENKLLRDVIEHVPEGVAVLDSGMKSLVNNQIGRQIFAKGSSVEEGPSAWVEQYGMFHADTVTAYAPGELPLVRALGGERVNDEEIFMRTPDEPEGRWIEISACPLCDEKDHIIASMCWFRDITQKRGLARAIANRDAAITATQEENEELIQRLQTSVRELSTPILELWDDILVLPVIGVVDTSRGAEMTERLLDELSRSRARYVILDLTGVEILDTSTAAHFMKLARAVELLGATCVLTGIRPAVAQSLVHLDVAFRSLATLHNLKHGLRYCLSRLRAEKGALEAKEKVKEKPNETKASQA